MALIVSIVQADAYFSTRMNGTLWTTLEEGSVGGGPDVQQKTAALTTAQNQLAVCYSLDSAAEIHRNAVCEQALFLIIGGLGAEKRKVLVAQGVIEAGIVEEKYTTKKNGISVCPYAETALAPYTQENRSKAFVVDITRDDSNYEG